MSVYPNNTSEPILTQWGDYEIAVRAGVHTWGSLAGQMSGSYEIRKAGRLLRNGSVAGGHATAEEAAANALRVAKLDAREALDGPFPAE